MRDEQKGRCTGNKENDESVFGRLTTIHIILSEVKSWNKQPKINTITTKLI